MSFFRGRKRKDALIIWLPCKADQDANSSPLSGAISNISRYWMESRGLLRPQRYTYHQRRDFSPQPPHCLPNSAKEDIVKTTSQVSVGKNVPPSNYWLVVLSSQPQAWGVILCSDSIIHAMATAWISVFTLVEHRSVVSNHGPGVTVPSFTLQFSRTS